MDLRHLKYFIAVAEELHFRRAAERLNISQPPLSQQVKLLELELGTALFERTNRRVALTQAGRLFLPEARAVIRQAERAGEVARKAHRGELGELRIGFFPSAPLVSEVSRAIRSFREAYPGVQLILNEMESSEQPVALLEEREDIAIVRSMTTPVVPASLTARLLASEPLVVALRRDHPLARIKGPLPVHALAEEPFVFYGDRMGTILPRLVLELCNKAGFEPRIGQLANANTTMIGLVAAGLGIAIIPSALGRLVHADVRVRQLARCKATVSVAVLTRASKPSKPVKAFLGLL
jgi:DNA-binding transcriptional LysR family regulator